MQAVNTIRTEGAQGRLKTQSVWLGQGDLQPLWGIRSRVEVWQEMLSQWRPEYPSTWAHTSKAHPTHSVRPTFISYCSAFLFQASFLLAFWAARQGRKTVRVSVKVKDYASLPAGVPQRLNLKHCPSPQAWASLNTQEIRTLPVPCHPLEQRSKGHCSQRASVSKLLEQCALLILRALLT